MIIIVTKGFYNNNCNNNNTNNNDNYKIDHLISARWPDLIIINNKKENLQNCGLCYPDWPQSNTESEKKDKYLNLARELKKLWNIKATVIPIVIGAFGTVTKGLVKGLEDMEIRGWVETI